MRIEKVLTFLKYSNLRRNLLLEITDKSNEFE